MPGAEVTARGFLLSATLLREKVASFADYPFNLSAIRELGTVTFDPAIIYLVGENGSAKSTLLEAIAMRQGSTKTQPWSPVAPGVGDPT
jgi:predicted ATPase